MPLRILDGTVTWGVGDIDGFAFDVPPRRKQKIYILKIFQSLLGKARHSGTPPTADHSLVHHKRGREVSFYL
jgi:hypothetical protein